MPNYMKVIPIRSYTSVADRQEEVADLAFEFWLSRFGLRPGSPEEDLFRAYQEVMESSSPRSTVEGLFLVRRSKS